MENWKAALAILSVVTLAIAAVIIITSVNIHNHGRVININLYVYSDADLTTPLTDIDWGYLTPGQSMNYTFYILNSGEQYITLRCSTANWVPTSASQYMSLSFSENGSVLAPGQSISAYFTLQVYNNVTGVDAFSFDIILEGVYQL